MSTTRSNPSRKALDDPTTGPERMNARIGQAPARSRPQSRMSEDQGEETTGPVPDLQVIEPQNTAAPVPVRINRRGRQAIPGGLPDFEQSIPQEGSAGEADNTARVGPSNETRTTTIGPEMEEVVGAGSRTIPEPGDDSHWQASLTGRYHPTAHTYIFNSQSRASGRQPSPILLPITPILPVSPRIPDAAVHPQQPQPEANQEEMLQFMRQQQGRALIQEITQQIMEPFVEQVRVRTQQIPGMVADIHTIQQRTGETLDVMDVIEGRINTILQDIEQLDNNTNTSAQNLLGVLQSLSELAKASGQSGKSTFQLQTTKSLKG
ncbi:hypothetical protein BDV93DRAFT_514582 [Ceratobasidium sp. AG-I]|nr:hypothetical protein BDV93DRAFT_514582 [Ceratobasidium sp. AG-I]